MIRGRVENGTMTIEFNGNSNIVIAELALMVEAFKHYIAHDTSLSPRQVEKQLWRATLAAKKTDFESIKSVQN